MQRPLASALLLLLLTAWAVPTSAQSFESGLKVGLISSTLVGDVASDFRYHTHLAAAFAFGYVYPNGLGVLPELTYVVKGGPSDTVIDDVPVRFESSLVYLELPVLLTYQLETRGSVHPKVFAGPALAVKLEATSEVRAASGGPSFQGPDDSIEPYDLGAVVGAGAAIDLAGERLSVDVRYSRGFLNVRDNEPALMNQAFMLMVGFVF